MDRKLNGKRVAMLVAQGFEEVELTEPRRALREAGAEVDLVSPEEGKVKAWAKTDWGKEYDVEVPLAQARPDDYDALVLPGGVMNPDHLRMNPAAVSFARAFFQASKPVAAICHGPWLLVDAEVLKGRTVTSYPSLHRDLENAGATWVDREVVTDRGLVTSRNPGDIPAFNRKMIEEIGEGAPAARMNRGTVET
jgi:protease I